MEREEEEGGRWTVEDGGWRMKDEGGVRRRKFARLGDLLGMGCHSKGSDTGCGL